MINNSFLLISLLIVSVITSGTLWYKLYLQKQYAAKQIAQKNLQLQHLTTEKEWLQKEVHHRVKNNLHTIICLLESQAVYLENDALKAIENSQHRIYAMSLIHQKMYQTKDLNTIDVGNYLPEFIQYLRDSFNTDGNINFELDIDPLQLDVSQAVPLALILNEAVTNSIKYAFPDKHPGNIKVALKKADDNVLLTISDNGIGIKQDVGKTVSNSLGIELMKGLSQDINGNIRFENNNGTIISITFKMGPLSEIKDLLSMPKDKEAAV